MKIKIIIGIVLLMIFGVLILAVFAPKDVGTKVEIKNRDPAVYVQPVVDEKGLDISRGIINTEKDKIPNSGAIYEFSKKVLNTADRQKIAKTFGLITYTEKSLIGTDAFLLEQNRSNFNDRIIISSENQEAVTYSSVASDSAQIKDIRNIEQWQSEAEKIASGFELPTGWSVKFEQLVYIKYTTEKEIFGTAENYDAVRFLYSYDFENKPVYGKNGYPIRFDFSSAGLNTAMIDFIPRMAILRESNLSTKNSLQLSDSRQYKPLYVIGDENYYTYGEVSKYIDILVSNEAFRTGYYFDEKLKQLWPYVFVDGVVKSKIEGGNAQILLGTSLIL